MAQTDYHYAQGRISRIEVENFKSYSGHQHIGPFKDFTAVIGPNGSGKSNLMDAISFVLGVKTQQLRGNLRELLYADSDNTSRQGKPRHGFVRLVFQTADGQEVTFARHIVPSSNDPSVEPTFRSDYKAGAYGSMLYEGIAH